MKMGACVQVISRELIKPSSETPHHLRKLKLSYLDQSLPSFYVPLVFFYQADELRGLTTSNPLQISQRLKNSLSNTLTSFYPLAGRIEDDFVVDCCDAGVEFIEARLNAQLMDIIQEPYVQDQKQYLPLDPTTEKVTTLVVVQTTFFDCGGVAVGLCFSHKIADFTSIMAFINAWAATSRGDTEFSRFSFDLASYFPSRNSRVSDFWQFLQPEQKQATKRFVFDNEKLAALKQVAASLSLKNPSRVEVVSVFFWKHFMEAAKSRNQEDKKTFAAFQAVNLRARKIPPQLLQNVFGNCFMVPFAISKSTECRDVEEFHDLTTKLRSAIRSINEEYIQKSQGGNSYLNDLFSLSPLLLKGELDWCVFSSWCGFPVYEVDYGWGNPVWVCSSGWPLKNFTVLMNSRCGDGIEVWVSTSQENIEMLETQIDLIPAATLPINS
ncbi:Stemmadenine O-acetyltransferase [Sesamum angolense]|uniref:Stemmadenine O-acetyltransferase n=1 Tax=Sesamum angolense TaxID=2727404 RepID=A0AAE1X6T9_9LAMI|nr:Stemmadenine O-acetyltransferase [Sesamum angolense]